MNVGFDYWHVISHWPEETLAMADAFIINGHEVHVISAIGKSRKGTIRGEVARAWNRAIAAEISVHEVDLPAPENKLIACQENGIELFFDDRADVCDLLNQNGILACQVYYLKGRFDSLEGRDR